jgi:hypothetical protein
MKTSVFASRQICPFGLSFPSLFQNRGKFAPNFSPGFTVLFVRDEFAPIFWRTIFSYKIVVPHPFPLH